MREILQSSHDLRGGTQRRSRYDVVKHDETAVWIVDRNGPLSVTNDAEGVCAELALHYMGSRIFYRDSDGNWDELVHDCGAFTGFKPARDRAIEV